jgi:hypothetical protein
MKVTDLIELADMAGAKVMLKIDGERAAETARSSSSTATASSP